MTAAKTKKNEYTGSSIQVLEGLEAVRKRPGMYIGSTAARGLHHLVWEVVDNSVDEALGGHADRIEVTLLADGGVRVKDNGRGMPVDMHPTEKKPTVEVILTVLHAGGKFDGKAYAVSGGLHGVGVSVVNALSSRLEVEIERDGFQWSQPYVDQKPAAPLKKGDPSKKHGTTVTFWADAGIFETVEFDFETIRRRIQEYAFLNKGLTIVLRDERVDKIVDEDDATADDAAKPKRAKEISYFYHGRHRRLRQAHQPDEDKEPIHKDVISFADEDTREEALGRDRDAVEQVLRRERAHLRQHDRDDRGRHARRGFRAALTNVVNKWAIDKKIIKDTKDDRLTGDDIREGLAAIISIKLGEPQFEGQTKTKLGNSSAQDLRPVGRQRLAQGLVREPPDRGQARSSRRSPRPRGRARPRSRPASCPQERARHVRHAGQAGRLPLDRPGPQRALHRRG